MKFLVTTRQIADALGVSPQAVLKRKNKKGWHPTEQRVQGGGSVYDLDTTTLSPQEKSKVRRWVIKHADRYIEMTEDIDELEAQKAELSGKIEVIDKKIGSLKRQLKSLAISCQEVEG